jgi:PAS domain S-box-containing protein
LDDIPVGLYQVEMKSGIERIKECNEAFIRMFGYEKPSEMMGFLVEDLWADPKEEHQNYLKDLIDRDNQNLPIMGREVQLKDKSDKAFPVEVSSRLLKDKKGGIIGRVGVLRNITGEIGLRKMRTDIGRVLHDYSSTLIMIKGYINPLVKALGFKDKQAPEVFDLKKEIESLDAPAGKVKDSLNAINQRLKESKDLSKSISEDMLDDLYHFEELLGNYKTEIPFPENRHSTLLYISTRIQEIIDSSVRKILPEGIIQDLKDKSKILEKECCLINLKFVKHRIVEMDSQIKSLREYINFFLQKPEAKRYYIITELINEVCFQLEEFSKSRNIEIIRQDNVEGAMVYISKVNVIRALVNLLHNAIKYSWTKDRTGETAEVQIRSFVKDKKLYIEFQNFGVPITKEEIKDDLLFQIGYRGEYSTDRHRMGTGIGLFDARETARSYGGDVKIESSPASDWMPDDDYTYPFVTKITFFIPMTK